jgi:hypothetical protein
MAGVNTDLANTNPAANTANTSGANTQSTPPQTQAYTPTEDQEADGDYKSTYETDPNEGSAVALANANDYGDPDYKSFNELDAGIGSRGWSYYGSGNENNAESQWSSPFNSTGNKFEYRSFYDQTSSYVYNSETGGGRETDPDKVESVKQDTLTSAYANQSEIDNSTAQLERHGEELQDRLDTLKELRADAEARGDKGGVEVLDQEIARTESAIADHDAKMTEYYQALSDYNVAVENLENAEGSEEVQAATQELIKAESNLATAYEGAWNVANSYNQDLHTSSDYMSPTLAESIGDSLRNGIANEAKDAVNLAETATKNIDALISMEENYIAVLKEEQAALDPNSDTYAEDYNAYQDEITAAEERITGLENIKADIQDAYQTATPEELVAVVQQAEADVNAIYENRDVSKAADQFVEGATGDRTIEGGTFLLGEAGEESGRNDRERLHEGGSTMTIEFSLDNEGARRSGVHGHTGHWNDRSGYIEVGGKRVAEVKTDGNAPAEYRTFDENGNPSEWIQVQNDEPISLEVNITNTSGHEVDESGNVDVKFVGESHGIRDNKAQGITVNDYTVTTTALNPEIAQQGAEDAFTYGPPEGSYISITGDHKSIDIGDDLRAEVPSVAEEQGIYEQDVTGTFQQLIQMGWTTSAIMDVLNDDTKGYQYFFDADDNLKEPPVEVTPEAEVAQTMS